MLTERPLSSRSSRTRAVGLALAGAAILSGLLWVRTLPLPQVEGGWFTVGLVVLAAAFPLSVVRYDWAVFLLFCLLSISYGGALGPLDMILPVLIAVGIIGRRLDPSTLWRPSWVPALGAIFAFGYGLSLFSVEEPASALIFSSNLLLRLALFAFFRMYLVTPQRAAIALGGYFISGSMGAAASLANHFGLVSLDGTFVGLDPGGRFTGLLGDPNVFGAFFVPLMILLVSETFNPRLWSNRVLKVGAIHLTFAMILLSFSRGAWLSLGAALVAYLAITAPERLRKSWREMTVLGASLVFTGAVLLRLSGFETYFLKRVRLEWYDIERFSTQANALAMSATQSLGVGPGQSGLVLGYGAHNLFLRLLLENGWVAFGAFSLFLMLLINGLWNRALPERSGEVSSLVRIPADAVLASMIGLLVNSLVIDSQTWRILWFVLALAWAVGYGRRALPREGQPDAASKHRPGAGPHG